MSTVRVHNDFSFNIKARKRSEKIFFPSNSGERSKSEVAKHAAGMYPVARNKIYKEKRKCAFFHGTVTNKKYRHDRAD